MICPATPIGSRSARLSALSGTGQDVAVDLRRQAAVVLEAGRDVGDVVLGFDDRLAAVPRLELGQLGGAGADDLGKLEQDPPAVLRRGRLPRSVVERGARGGHRPIDVGRGWRRARAPITSQVDGSITSSVADEDGATNSPPI